MSRFEYLAFEQKGQLYGILIDQIDVVTQGEPKGEAPLDDWLGFRMEGRDRPRFLKVKSSGLVLAVFGVKGIWASSMERVWPVPKLIAAHRQDRLFWGVCQAKEKRDELVLLVDTQRIRQEVSCG